MLTFLHTMEPNADLCPILRKRSHTVTRFPNSQHTSDSTKTRHARPKVSSRLIGSLRSALRVVMHPAKIGWQLKTTLAYTGPTKCLSAATKHGAQRRSVKWIYKVVRSLTVFQLLRFYSSIKYFRDIHSTDPVALANNHSRRSGRFHGVEANVSQRAPPTTEQYVPFVSLIDTDWLAKNPTYNLQHAHPDPEHFPVLELEIEDDLLHPEDRTWLAARANPVPEPDDE